MDITKKLEEARKCINQALIGLGTQEKVKEDIFEIRIPNLRPNEIEIVRIEINAFTKQLLNNLQTQRNRNA